MVLMMLDDEGLAGVHGGLKLASFVAEQCSTARIKTSPENGSASFTANPCRDLLLHCELHIMAAVGPE
jgi:hypothetical protein